MNTIEEQRGMPNTRKPQKENNQNNQNNQSKTKNKLT